MTQRVFTRIGKSIRRDGAIPADKLEETTDVVERQVRHARELGAERIAIVATAAVRQARNGGALTDAIEAATGLPTQVLSEEDEARLAFLGASKTLGTPFEGNLCVVDVGGGSTEIAIGSMEEGVTWSQSFRVGSGLLADSYLLSDPPSAHELQAARAHAGGVFEGLRTPPIARAVASGGSATSLRRMAGGELSHEALERAIRLLASAPAIELAERFELDPERVRLLPAGVLILEAVGDSLGTSLKIGNGGIREGVVLELAAGG
jgi:exopolyphosphatase/guanosine-5'-triphosphate,3'-diphosphate pyrophosphatase